MAESGLIVTFGVAPDGPSTDYGYLKPYYERVLALQSAGAQVEYNTVTANKLTYQAEFGKQQAAMMPMGTWYVATLIAQQAKVEIIEPQRRTSEADLRGALANPDQAEPPAQPAPEGSDGGADGGATNTNPPGASTGPTAGPGSPTQDDYQLSRALDLLRGISLFRTSQMN